jgi:hypothetical protein
MAVLASKTVNDQLVYHDAALPWRWLDAIGPNVVKWHLLPEDVISTTTAVGSTITATNGTLIAVDSANGGGAILVTVAGGDNDKVEAQSFAEQVSFASAWPAYFGVKLGQMVDADQTDVSAGWIIRDTDIAAGTTDGIYFRIVDESAVLSLVVEQDSVETTVILFTAVEATDYVLELYYDGTNVYAYVNGVLAATVAGSNANFPNDEHLCPTVAIQSGEAAVNNVRLYWARSVQIQN